MPLSAADGWDDGDFGVGRDWGAVGGVFAAEGKTGVRDDVGQGRVLLDERAAEVADCGCFGQVDVDCVAADALLGDGRVALACRQCRCAWTA